MWITYHRHINRWHCLKIYTAYTASTAYNAYTSYRLNLFTQWYAGCFFLLVRSIFSTKMKKTCSANEELFYIENFVKN